MTRQPRSEKEEKDVRGPVEWLFHICLLLLGCAIALTLALELLRAIWPWLVAGLVVVGGIAIAVRVATARRRQW